MLTIASKWVTPYRITVLIALGLLGVGLWVIINFLQAPSPLPMAVTTYQHSVIATNDKPLCPGDKVTYDQVACFKDTPVTVVIASTVWSVDRGITVVPDRQPAYVNYTQPATVTLHGEWEVPKDFPPGRYERRMIGTAFGHKAEGFTVPFTVAKDCNAQ